MANYNSKKRKTKGANVKPIEEMVDKEKTSADSYFEKLEETKNIKGDVNNMENVVNMKDVFVDDVELVNEVEKEVKEVTLEEMYKEEIALDVADDIDEEALRVKEILDSHIKYAILSSKELGKRGILSKQFKAIVNGYKRETGFDMSQDQQLYIKKLTDIQGSKVLEVINAYNRYKINKEIQQRINARRLATNE